MIDNTHYNLTFKLALAGIDGDHVNEHFTDWAAKKVATFSEIQPEDVYVSQLKSGAEHKIGGIWTARFLAAAAFIVVFVNFFGLYSLYKDDRFLMAAHLCFSLAGILLLIISAALMGKHANATSRLIANNWHSIQNKVIGAGVEPVDAGAFARAHFKAAARSAPPSSSCSSPPSCPRSSPSSAMNLRIRFSHPPRAKMTAVPREESLNPSNSTGSTKSTANGAFKPRALTHASRERRRRLAR